MGERVFVPIAVMSIYLDIFVFYHLQTDASVIFRLFLFPALIAATLHSTTDRFMASTAFGLMTFSVCTFVSHLMFFWGDQMNSALSLISLGVRMGVFLGTYLLLNIPAILRARPRRWLG